MFRSVIKFLENPEMPVLGLNHRLLVWTGLILPKSTKIKLYYIALHVFAGLFSITEYIELYYIRTNVDLVLTNLKISMLSIVVSLKAFSFMFWNKEWKEVIEYVNDADKFERETSDEDRSKIVHNITTYCRRVSYFYLILCIFTTITLCSQPFPVYMTTAAVRESYRNGTTDFPQMFSAWMPFDKNQYPWNYVTVAYHAYVCCYGGSIIATYDCLVVVIMVFVKGKLELLRDRCQKMIKNVETDFTYTVKELHTIHVELIKHSKLFNSLFSPVLFLYVVMSSLVLCASIYQTTTAGDTSQRLLTAEYLIFGVIQLFVYCWHSNDVSITSENVMLGPYESEWWKASPQRRKQVLLLMGQLNTRIIYTAGPFTSVNVYTFITILKGAYSYYTLVK